MATRGEERRERILQVAEATILKKGFTVTSIDDILQQAHIAKGGFFYHFPGKAEPAKGLVERFLVTDAELFNGLFRRARGLRACEKIEGRSEGVPGRSRQGAERGNGGSLVD